MMPAMDPATAGDGGPPAPRRRRIRDRLRSSGPFFGGILAALIAVAAYGYLRPAPAPLTQRQITDTIDQVLASQTPAPAISELVYAAVQPALVLIEVDGTDAQGAPTHGLGSGVVVNASGEILTALHVVADATTIKLTFADGSTSPATVTSTQPSSDIAVLQPASLPSTVTPATLGSPRSVRVGSDAYIVGNPFGLAGSLSAGVVSGLDRSYQVPGGSQVISGLIQVDAAVNPGNSGGPLLNRGGQVIGIVTALVNPTKEDVFIGIGLAVPIDTAGAAAGLPQY
jgi:S1-C subfamily serine protease